MISEIKLVNVLPRVFRGSENEPPVCRSQVWLRNLDFKRGQWWLVAAESGTGKSSLCAFLFGSRSDYDGSILFDGVDIRSFSIDHWGELRRKSLAYLPQEMGLFPELTAMENILLKNRLTDFKTEVEISGMLNSLGIDAAKSRQRAATLSIGQQQRVAIVRALCQPFDFLLVDEPVSHLDQRSNRAVASLIADQARAQEAAVIATSVGNHLSLENMQLLNL